MTSSWQSHPQETSEIKLAATLDNTYPENDAKMREVIQEGKKIEKCSPLASIQETSKLC